MMKGKSLEKVSKLGQVLATYVPSVCSMLSPMLLLGKQCRTVLWVILLLSCLLVRYGFSLSRSTGPST